MDSKLWVIIALLIVIGILTIVAILMKKNKKQKPDYYALFTMGIIWTALGVPLKNYAISAVGIVFLIIGLANKDKWKDNRHSWDKLDKNQKMLKATIIGVLFLLVIVGVLVFLFTKQNI
ncbi:MAG: hypothetical protein ABH884_00210 [Candidatus Komeilibacteria bacterium]